MYLYSLFGSGKNNTKMRKMFGEFIFELEPAKRVKNRAKNSLNKNVFTGSQHRPVFTRNELISSCLYKTETSLGELLVLIEHYETPSEFWYYNVLSFFEKFLNYKQFLAQCGNWELLVFYWFLPSNLRKVQNIAESALLCKYPMWNNLLQIFIWTIRLG